MSKTSDFSLVLIIYYQNDMTPQEFFKKDSFAEKTGVELIEIKEGYSKANRYSIISLISLPLPYNSAGVDLLEKLIGNFISAF